MLICYRTRRRLGAYLDEALPAGESARATAHIAACARCHAEVHSLRRLAALLRQTAPSPALPDWTGFWEGVRRGIEAPAVERPLRRRWQPRLVAATTAGALAVAAAAVLWQAPPTTLAPQAAALISVSSANTDHPNGTVMVYSPPERDLAVVWVFAEDN